MNIALEKVYYCLISEKGGDIQVYNIHIYLKFGNIKEPEMPMLPFSQIVGFIMSFFWISPNPKLFDTKSNSLTGLLMIVLLYFYFEF